MKEERRRLNRRNFSLYMRVLDEQSGKVVGTILDISTGGFRLESKMAIPLNTNLRLRIDHTDEISRKKFMTFVAIARWCQRDRLESTIYKAGFQITDMTPADRDTFIQMFNSYGSKDARNHPDYSWT